MVHRYLPDSRDDTRRLLSEVLELTAPYDETAFQRWRCYARSQLSQIAEAADEALSLATLAHDEARDRKLRACQVDALLSRAEVRLRSSAETHQAREDLKHVREFELVRDSANYRLGARCDLLTARSYVLEHKEQEAEECLNRVRKMIDRVSHASLKDLFATVQRECDAIRAEGEFRLRPSDQHDYKRYLQHLRRWLIAQARQRHKGASDLKLAESLGVTRTTLYLWEKESKASVKPDRPADPSKKGGDQPKRVRSRKLGR